MRKDLDEVFKALADGSRRELLDRLRAENGQTLGDLCTRLSMTRQAVSKHLAILDARSCTTSTRSRSTRLRNAGSASSNAHASTR
jgi:DNA-binding transcriptional ArsR family regulator